MGSDASGALTPKLLNALQIFPPRFLSVEGNNFDQWEGIATSCKAGEA